MEFRKVVTCSKCQQPIVPGADLAYVCFKIPGMDGYHFFHYRFRTGDCWEAYLTESQQK